MNSYTPTPACKNNINLEAARQQALAAGDPKVAFIAVISHDFRTPLNGIWGWRNAAIISIVRRTGKSVSVIQDAAKLLA